MTARIIALIGVALVLLAVAGCNSTGTRQGDAQRSALTPGMTKKFIAKGQTTQTEVLEIFGPPNLVTRKNDTEVWTYDRLSQEFQQSGGGLAILGIGAGSSGGFGSGGGFFSSSGSRSSRSTMLIIYFDESETVVDYRLSSAQF